MVVDVLRACIVIAAALVAGVVLGRGVAQDPDLEPPSVPVRETPPASCDDSVALAVAATEVRCSGVLDCRNVDRHPQDCSADCKYHALEAALPLHEPELPYSPYLPPLEPYDVDRWQPEDETP